MDLKDKALAIAIRAHTGQTRKTDDTPYIEHPKAVAEILESYDFPETVVAAALVHDVLEDTEVGEEELRRELGDEVVDIVTAVSEDKSLEWEDRKERYIKSVAESSDATKAVSIADKIHNAQSLIEAAEDLGPEVWTMFNRGKAKKIWFERSLCNAVAQTWSHLLLDRYSELVLKMENLDD